MITDLIARLEAATSADRGLDEQIRCAINGWSWSPNRHQSVCDAPAYTASLDAALTLVPEGAFWSVGHDGEGADPSLFLARVLVADFNNTRSHKAVADTPALALCIAALKARLPLETMVT